jgi:hypothetical protein
MANASVGTTCRPVKFKSCFLVLNSFVPGQMQHQNVEQIPALLRENLKES